MDLPAPRPRGDGERRHLSRVAPAPPLVAPAGVWIAGGLAGLLPLVGGLLGHGAPPAQALSALLWGYALAALPWLHVVRRWRALPPDRATCVALVLGALALRVALVALPPLLSEDAWRYLWDGLVAEAGLNPYGLPPDAGALDAVGAQSAAHAAVRSKVGHPHLPTIYPPAAQWGFGAVAAAAGPRLWALRVTLATGDALVVWGLWRWLAARGARPQAAAVYAFCPLPMVEAAVGGHVDAWGVALLVAGGAALAAGRPVRGGALIGSAIATKLLPIIALPALLRQAPWALLGVGCAVAVFALPYVDADAAALGGLAAYGSRWRGNAGAFDLLAWPFERLWPPGEAPLEAPPWAVAVARRLVGTPQGIDPDRLWPDEAAFAAAKAVALLLMGTVWLWALWRARTFDDLLRPAVLGLCLLAPVVYPWYLSWPLALVVAAGPATGRWTRRATLTWVSLAWLAYVPRVSWLAGAAWAEPWWTRALVYVPVWLMVAFAGQASLNVRPSVGR